MNLYAPIILFVYKRPALTRLTLETLSRNPESKFSTLYIFCDGPKANASADDLSAIHQVREIVAERDWCASVHIEESPVNLGLAKSILTGIDRIFEMHDRVIVLEDDIETAPGFLRYMNDALNLYQRESRVMHISAYLPATSYARLLPETFFHSMMLCWGWGTWRRAWHDLQLDGPRLLDEIRSSPRGVHGFDVDGSFPLSHQLIDNIEGRIHTWAVFWAASVYLRDGLCLIPGKSLVRNTGVDGSGVHFTEPKSHFLVDVVESVPVRPKPLVISWVGNFYLRSFFTYGRDSSFRRRMVVFCVHWAARIRARIRRINKDLKLFYE